MCSKIKVSDMQIHDNNYCKIFLSLFDPLFDSTVCLFFFSIPVEFHWMLVYFLYLTGGKIKH